MVQESQQNKKCSAADLYVVPYGRYNLMESMPLSMMKHLEDDVPPVFMILDTFDKDIKVIFCKFYFILKGSLPAGDKCQTFFLKASLKIKMNYCKSIY